MIMRSRCEAWKNLIDFGVHDVASQLSEKEKALSAYSVQVVWNKIQSLIYTIANAKQSERKQV